MKMIAIAILASVLAVIYGFLFRHLPHERWQFLAAIPVRKTGDGQWHGVNITFYGIIISAGMSFSLASAFFLCGALGYTYMEIGIVSALILGLCVPAVKLMAWIVERRRGTITIGGGSFVGFIAAPWIVMMVFHFTRSDAEQYVLPLLAVFCTAYAFGEGIGRLSCISFGCCYGRPVSEVRGIWGALFSRLGLTFTGSTRKAVYAGHLAGVKLVPVQAITAVISTAAGLAGLALLMYGYPTIALAVTLTVTQAWRFASEFLRADYRGGAGNRISAYQWMNIITILYYVTLMALFRSASPCVADMNEGISFLWNPAVILAIQAVSFAIMIYTGVSTVTASEISFHVKKECTCSSGSGQ